MSNVIKDQRWFQKHKQTVVLSVVVLLLAILVGVAIYAEATTSVHLT